MAVLEFIFSGFLHFIGTVILAGLILEGTADIVRAFRSKRP